MLFEVLVEDQSGCTSLDVLLPKILGTDHSYRLHAYKGVGRIPATLKTTSDPSKRALLNQLPRLLQGYGRTFANYPKEYRAAVVIVCDLDDANLTHFRKELSSLLQQCNPKPITRFCIAVEEFEAWFLGDVSAVQKAYPKANSAILKSYDPDSIVGTWERLADAVYSGGHLALQQKGYQAIGYEKSRWAQRISPYMDVWQNRSPSFQSFRDTLRSLAEQSPSE